MPRVIPYYDRPLLRAQELAAVRARIERARCRYELAQRQLESMTAAARLIADDPFAVPAARHAPGSTLRVG